MSSPTKPLSIWCQEVLDICSHLDEQDAPQYEETETLHGVKQLYQDGGL